MRVVIPLLYLLIILLTGCAVTKDNYNPDKKYSKEQIQNDFRFLKEVFEKKHPSLYWYTSKETLNQIYDSLYKSIPDSMTELQFGWKILAPYTNRIRCGHTSFSMSKGWNKYIKKTVIPSFPLHLKVWKDTMVVIGNLNKKDSVFKNGMLITAINGIKNEDIIQEIFSYLPLDGYANNVNYIRLSSNFPFYHRNVFGIYNKYKVEYIDSAGNKRMATLPMFVPEKDTAAKKKKAPAISKAQAKKQFREFSRNMVIEDSTSTATITLNTFSKRGGTHLRSFFRRSFRTIKKKKIEHLILDLRRNGGGDVSMYVLLTKYLRHTPFKVADTTYAVTKSLHPYAKHFTDRMVNSLALRFLTKKHKDGNYHFGYWERKEFDPKINNHFYGKLYVLINGPTFFASTLFCNAIKGQENTLLIGEEAGGGWYGNSGIIIPDLILPNTKLRVRLPFFRIVQYNHIDEKGSGVTPDIFVGPSIDAIKKEQDSKIEYTKALIQQSTTK